MRARWGVPSGGEGRAVVQQVATKTIQRPSMRSCPFSRLPSGLDRFIRVDRGEIARESTKLDKTCQGFALV